MLDYDFSLKLITMVKSTQDFVIRVFDKESISDFLVDQYFVFIHSIWKELHPSEPLPSEASMRQHFFEPVPNKLSFSWLAFKEEELVGSCDLLIENPESPFFEERKHKGQFWMNVSKNHRRMNLGTQILRTIVAKATEFEYVESLELTGATPLKESISFCEKLGGKVTFEAEENRLYFDDINWNTIQQLKDDALKDFSDFKVEVFDKIPETIIKDYSEAFSEFRHEKPFNEIPQEDRITPERLRDFETQLEADQTKWLHFLVKDNNGDIIALSNLRYQLDSLERINETLAAIKSNYRETKIKDILKSEMLLYIRDSLPEVQKIFIYFEHPIMENLNREIGFTKHSQGKHFEFNLKELKKLL